MHSVGDVHGRKGGEEEGGSEDSTEEVAEGALDGATGVTSDGALREDKMDCVLGDALGFTPGSVLCLRGKTRKGRAILVYCTFLEWESDPPMRTP